MEQLKSIALGAALLTAILVFWSVPAFFRRFPKEVEAVYPFATLLIATSPAFFIDQVPADVARFATYGVITLSLGIVVSSYIWPVDRMRLEVLRAWLTGSEVPTVRAKSDRDAAYQDSIIKQYYKREEDWQLEPLADYVSRHGSMPDGSPPSERILVELDRRDKQATP